MGITLPERIAMETAGLVTFVLIAGFVWGGLAWILSTAIRKEGRKAGGE